MLKFKIRRNNKYKKVSVKKNNNLLNKKRIYI